MTETALGASFSITRPEHLPLLGGGCVLTECCHVEQTIVFDRKKIGNVSNYISKLLLLLVFLQHSERPSLLSLGLGVGP